MTFRNYFNKHYSDDSDNLNDLKINEDSKVKEIQELKTLKESSNVEDIIRKNFKIKSIFGTKFGTEYLLAKTYKKEDIDKILKDFPHKIDGKSIFISAN